MRRDSLTRCDDAPVSSPHAGERVPDIPLRRGRARAVCSLVAGVIATLTAAPAFAAEGAVQFIHYLPGYEYLAQWANHDPIPPMLDMGHISPDALIYAVLVSLLLVGVGFLARRQLLHPGEERLLPAKSLGSRLFVEDITTLILGFLEDMVGPKLARQFLPLIATYFIFILSANLIGLIPGLGAATSNLSLNWGMAVIIFMYYNYIGFREHGAAYIKHFMGPFWWLAWLMLVIELIGHIVRPVTLSLRLAMNMTADHMVVALFTDLTKLVVPVIFLGLGVLISFIQAAVFTLLSCVYLKLASDHDH